MNSAMQPDLGLESGSIDPTSETALRAAYLTSDWARRKISFAYALTQPALKTILRIRAEIAARKT